MDLIVAAADRVRGWALGRPAVSVLAPPDRTSLGWRVEAAVRSRGWGRADSPADADLLLLVGDLGNDLAPATRLWWHHMTAPRAQVAVTDEAQVDQVLDDALARLRDWPAQREGAERTDETVALLQARDAPEQTGDGAHDGHDMGGHDTGEHGGHDMSGHDMGGSDMGGSDMGGSDMSGHDMSGHDMSGHDMSGHDMSGHDMSGHDMSGHDMSGHGGHDMGGHGGHDMGGHGGHDMGDVAGLPMAGTGQDRDGLELDVLTYRWGPFLPGWPTGLVVRATVAGDVVSDATVEQQPGPAEPLPRLCVVAHCLVTVLGLAGWHSAERALGALPLAGLDGRTVTDDERRWLSRVRRSRTLRWALRDIADVDGQDAGARVATWCEELLAGAATEGTWTVLPDSDLVSQVVTGTEMARARIAVASIALTPAATDAATGHRDADRHRRHDGEDLS